MLAYYFDMLKVALNENKMAIDTSALKVEWRQLHAIAWADFRRFLLGWMPIHQKLNSYSKKIVKEAISLVKKKN